ncbi:uncharacterized protein LOC107636951 [Arachis ipaensis]|uniref:uncharacterized protein LOC107636951 n=1 Tax=Arachis ipaensis TaxID=130454 RepID=UPI0007AF4067|nr:uncharacterized protein LOC107636951 [Arachis ipaensis]
MGFDTRWRAWVAKCIRSASISIMVNGSPSKPFKMERGLRQEEETVRNYKRLLRCFEVMSGLSINFEKSSLIPVNCSEEWVERMCRVLGCQTASLPVKYLGINLGVNPRLVKTWKPVIDKVEDKLSLWKAKVLSKAGKLVLIKSVLNSLPVYYLSLYKMPTTVAKKLISLQRRFFWGKDDGKAGLALVKWELIQAPKKLGRLGVGDAMICNTALLFKWWWRFSKEDCPLWKKIVCSCNNLNPGQLLSTQALPAKGGPWKDICNLQIKEQTVRQKMIDGLAIEVGDGRATRFWEDTWLQSGKLKDSFSRLFLVSNNKGYVLQEHTLKDDISRYKYTNGIWKGLVPPGVKFFTWFVLVGRVNTKDRLNRLGIIDRNDNICVMCNKDLESVQHLFVTCEYDWQNKVTDVVECIARTMEVWAVRAKLHHRRP